MYKFLLIGLIGFFLASCSWVKLTEEGEKVSVRDASEVSDCKKVARTTAELRSKVMGINRNADKVKKELETLARNAAVDYGGNVVVPESEIMEGKQSFNVYNCP